MTSAVVAAGSGQRLVLQPAVDDVVVPLPPEWVDAWGPDPVPVWCDGWWDDPLDGVGVAAGSAADAETAGELWRYDDRQLLALVEEAAAVVARAHARWLGLLAEVERRQAALGQTSLPTASWLATGTRLSARAARAEVRLATLLSERPVVSAALAAGSLSVEQAAVLAHGLDRLPHGLDATQQAEVEQHLVDLAGEFGPTALRRLVNHAVEVVCPDVAEAAALTALERAERAQQRERYVSWRRDHDGGWLLSGKLTALDGELLTRHLDALATGQRHADAAAGIDTSRSQARADALALVVAHHAGCAGGPVRGGDHTRVLITLDYHHLATGLGQATLIETDQPLSAGQVRHLACTAGLIPAVLDGPSQPLDLGRSERLFTPAQRAALALRDGGCAFPGCDRPPADCEAHHTIPWHAGGPTDLDNGVLLCPHHHRLVEPDPRQPDHTHWHITLDARGRPRFTTPARPDGTRTTRQHHRYRT